MVRVSRSVRHWRRRLIFAIVQSMRTIVQVGEPVLRKRAEEVPIREITGQRIRAILHDMEQALNAEPDGAALAAPQIGVPLRIFILSRKVFAPKDGVENNDEHFVFINPHIVKRSKRKHRVDEGCLSVRGKYGTIMRSTNVTIEAYDEHGAKFIRGAGGLMAQAFQHETDHLDGVLFIDSAGELWDIVAKKHNEVHDA